MLDEPTTGLDATVEAEVLDLIEELRDRINAAILLISHNLGLVARLCERVGVMYAGRIVEEGPARELFTDPRHPYTMGLLRCVPRFGVRKDTSTLEPIPGLLPRLGATAAGLRVRGALRARAARVPRREPDLFPWPGRRRTRRWSTRHAEARAGRPVARAATSHDAAGHAARRPTAPHALLLAPRARATSP